MWILDEKGVAAPFLPQPVGLTPTHNRPTQTLAKIWVQNASLEIVRREAVFLYNSISGKSVMGFEMPGYEGFDVNTELDWQALESLIARHPSLLRS
jgi:CMP-N-acetylneuraminic acid synthetase